MLLEYGQMGKISFLFFLALLVVFYGCSATQQASETTTTLAATTTTQADVTTTTTSTSTTTVTFGVLTRHPTIDATEISSTETLTLQFSRAISYEAMTAANFFADYAAFGSFHNAGTPELSSASLTWEAATNTLYLSGISAWSSYEAGATYKVYASPQSGKIKDLEGNILGTNVDLWEYTLKYVQDPYDGDPIDGSVFTHYVTDETGDAVQMSTPPNPDFYFDENDIRRVSVALVNDRLVCSVEVVGIMNNTLEATPFGTQEVDYRDISIGLDLDNNADTGYAPGGGWGMDIQITLYRGLGVYPDCQWGVYEFNETDTHEIDRFWGQVHAGGQGYDYAVFSAPVSAVDYLGVTIEAGMTYVLMGWSEAETLHDMTLDFALDTIEENSSSRVETVLGGE